MAAKPKPAPKKPAPPKKPRRPAFPPMKPIKKNHSSPDLDEF